MRNILSTIAVATLVASAAAAPAFAGPCSDDIASLTRQLDKSSTLGGAPTSGTISSGGANHDAANPNADQLAKGTTAGDKKVGGDVGMKEMNAASGQVATSPEDVRRQQQGVPTTANAPGTKTPEEGMSQAKMELEKARTLDAQGNASCAASVSRARQLAGK